MPFRLFLVKILIIWLAGGSVGQAHEALVQGPEAPPPFATYKVTPDTRGRFLSVEAEFKIATGSFYLKDFGQLDSIQWYADGKEIRVSAKRTKDLITFSRFPAAGAIRAVYKLNCVMQPIPGYRKRLIGSPNFILAREGLFIGIGGSENSLVDVRWILPSGWQLAVGGEGMIPFSETQKTLWVAGKTKQFFEQKIDGKIFKIAVLAETSDLAAQQSVVAVKSVFQYAWKYFGPLQGETFSLAFFAEGSIGGGTALNYSLASEENLVTSVHEMLHWWTNFRAPAWFREGVHTYIATKLLTKLGIVDPSLFDAALTSFLQEHEKVVKREGKLSSLEESSENYDRQRGGGDMYGLMPLLAYKLDREIQALRPNAGLEQVFAAVSQKRLEKPDLFALVKDITGYDPGPLFQKYFSVKVENPSDLLK